jgi:diguanylate cyclase (GGDEF)-like protein
MGQGVQQQAKQGVEASSFAERRAFVRLPIELPARLSRQGGWAVDVTIRDFCAGGLFVDVPGLDDDYLLLDGRQVMRDDAIRVSFKLEGAAGAAVQDLDARVARVIGGGVGVAFVNPDTRVLGAMREHALRVRGAADDGETGSLDADTRGAGDIPAFQLYTACAETYTTFLRKQAAQVFEHVDEQLFVAARDAKSNLAQSETFDAQRELKRIRASVENDFFDAVRQEVENLWSGEHQSSRGEGGEGGGLAEGELSLVDTASFDDWLTVKGIISRWESKFEDATYALARRLSVLVGRSIGEHEVPYGVQAVCFAFHESAQNLGASKRSREALFHSFEEILIRALAGALDEINRKLIAAGVLPTVERPAPGAGTKKPSRRASPAPGKGPAAPEDAPQPPEIAPELDLPGGDSGWWGPASGPASGFGAGGQWPGAQGERQLSPLEQVAAAASPPTGPAPNPGQAPQGGAAPGPYPGQAPQGGAAPGPYPGQGPQGGAAPGPYPGQAPQGGAAPGPYPGQAPQGGAAPGPYPGQAPQGAAGAGWIDPGVSPGVGAEAAAEGTQGASPGGWGFGPEPASLAPPERMLGQAYVTARSLLGLQRSVGNALRGGGAMPPAARAEQEIDEAARRGVLEALSRAQRSGFSESLGENGALALGERLRARLAKDGVDVGEAESDAIDVISGLMNAILDDPFVDQNVKSRLRKLSLPLLRAALYDDGFLGNRSHAARQVVDRLGQVELPSSSADGGDSLQTSVDPVVDRIVTEHENKPGVFAEVLPEIDAMLERQRQRYANNVERLVLAREAQEAIVKTLRGGAADSQASGSHGDSESSTSSQAQNGADRFPAKWRRSLDRAARLEPDAVVALDAGTSDARRATLAWVDGERGTFMFVNGAGERIASLTRQELALGIHRGSIHVSETQEEPVTERGIYSMLQGLHEGVRREATHDPLTGLLNAKHFRIQVEEAREDAARESTVHVACYLRVDSYEAVRDACSERAANALLVKIARVIEKHVGDRGVVGRLGEDRFTILYRNCAPVEASHLVERQRRSIEQSRCVYHGQEFSLSLSTGIAPVTDESPSADAVLEAAEAACDEAREAGGKRTQVREEQPPVGESNIAEIQPLASLTELLEAEQLALRCQPVQPIGDSRAKPFYEVLLGMRADDGGLVPVANLIEAVEREGRMDEVDRWVIRTTLQWMSANRRMLAKLGGFAINLSGNSLAQPELLAYVIQEFNSSKVPPGKVMFELTESAAVDGLSGVQDFIRTMREYGCRFSLDDFGAGESSIGHLKSLPVDKVKIDGQFVRDMADNAGDQAMVRSINEIAHLLGKETVAEHAESEVVIARLAELGVDYAQGHAVGKPFPLDSLEL